MQSQNSRSGSAIRPRLVMKFGGTSVATVERIKNVAQHVKREVEAGYDVAVVVSAMSGKTNELVAWVKEASPLYDAREYDTVVASGEQVTSGLLAICLQAIGLKARQPLAQGSGKQPRVALDVVLPVEPDRGGALAIAHLQAAFDHETAHFGHRRTFNGRRTHNGSGAAGNGERRSQNENFHGKDVRA